MEVGVNASPKEVMSILEGKKEEKQGSGANQDSKKREQGLTKREKEWTCFQFSSLFNFFCVVLLVNNFFFFVVFERNLKN